MSKQDKTTRPSRNRLSLDYVGSFVFLLRGRTGGSQTIELIFDRYMSKHLIVYGIIIVSFIGNIEVSYNLSFGIFY